MFIAHRFFTFSATFTGFPTPLNCLSITQMTRTCYFYPTRTISSHSFFLNNRSRSKLNSEPSSIAFFVEWWRIICLFEERSSMVSLILHSIDARKYVADLFFSLAYYYFHNKLNMRQVRQRRICWKTLQVAISAFVCDRYIGLPFDPLYQLPFYIYCST